MRSQLDHQAIQRIRRSPGESILLYITDRCPVGCRHCSVDSRPDSPRIENWEQFELVVSEIEKSRCSVVAISGGEPFVERRGLPYAVASFANAGKSTVIFTSGYWAPEKRAPAKWVTNTLQEIATVYLSTDGFHNETISRDRFANALTSAAEAGCHIIVQALSGSKDRELAEQVLDLAFGECRPTFVELNLIEPLIDGRGAGVFQITRRVPAGELPPCALLGSQTVRYDGRVYPCCQESVITGKGPRVLGGQVTGTNSLSDVLEHFRRSSLLADIASDTPTRIIDSAGLPSLGDERYGSICELCWRAHAAIDAV